MMSEALYLYNLCVHEELLSMEFAKLFGVCLGVYLEFAWSLLGVRVRVSRNFSYCACGYEIRGRISIVPSGLLADGG